MPTPPKQTAKQKAANDAALRGEGVQLGTSPPKSANDKALANEGVSSASMKAAAARQAAAAKAKADAAAAKAKAKDKDTFTANAAASKVATANAAHGNVWVNGQMMTLTGFAADGTPQYSYQGGNTDKSGVSTPKSINTAFNALSNLPANLTGNEQFTMSIGAQTGADGNPVDVWGKPLTATSYTAGAHGDHSASANTATGRNMMTVGQGVQWFLNLSVQNPTAYGHLVQQLKAANYLPKTTPEAGYNPDAASAFAQAAAALAQVNTTEGGVSTTLDQFLSTQAASSAATAQAAYQPVNRAYQDPASLHASARAAAEDALGRKLTTAEQAKFDASFRAKENAAYDAVDASGKAQLAASQATTPGSAPGATYTTPDTAGEADAFVQGDQFQQQRAGYSALQYVKSLKTFLGGS